MLSNAESFRFREWDRDRCFDGLGLCGRAEPIVLLCFVCFRAFLHRAPSLGARWQLLRFGWFAWGGRVSMWILLTDAPAEHCRVVGVCAGGCRAFALSLRVFACLFVCLFV